MIKLIKSTFLREAETKEKLINFLRKTSIFSMSKECQKFEKAFAKKQGRKFAVFTNSGSSANLLLIRSLLNLAHLKKGDKVGVSTLTWSTNVMPVIELDLKPVFIDCELQTLNVSPAIFQKYLQGLKAFFLTNVLGFSDKIDEIQKICEKNKIIFIEDNCESLGSKVKGKLLGNFSLASTFSFFVGHHVSTIEGGMICTDDEELFKALLMARAHGWDRNLSNIHQKQLRKQYNIQPFLAKYTFYDLAYNIRPTEINGFLGNTQLLYWDWIIKRRFRNFKIFHKKIEKNDDFIALKINHMDIVSNFAMPVVCKSEEIFQKYKNKFEKADVEIRPIIAGDITLHPFFKKYVTKNYICKNAKFVYKHGFYFPNNPELTDEEVNFMARLLIK